MLAVLRNISFTFLSNIVCTVVSVLVVFFVPKSVGVENYGYFQLYLFYINYTGFLHFGWADGVYLRYGGAYYKDLDKSMFATQFRLFVAMELLFSIVLCCWAYFFVDSTEKQVVYSLIGVSMFLALPKTFLQYVLQGTNRIKEYATLIMIERVVYGSLALIIVFVQKDSFSLIIGTDLVGKFIALLYAFYHCRDIVFGRFGSLKDAFTDIVANVRVGIKLMLANVASLLILGVVRWSIEREWDVSVFGKISLTLSISNLMMLFIRSVSMVLLPTLRRTDSSKYASIYSSLKIGFLVAMFGALLLYYPLNSFLLYWLPAYADSLKYMAILFPLCIYEGKLSLLVETYLKTMRMEKILLLSNIVTLVFSCLLTVLFVFVLENLTWTVLAILLIFAFRTFLGEFLLSRKMPMCFFRDGILECALTVSFVFVAWFLDNLVGMLVYGALYLMYALFYRKKLRVLITMIKSSMKKSR